MQIPKQDFSKNTKRTKLSLLTNGNNTREFMGLWKKEKEIREREKLKIQINTRELVMIMLDDPSFEICYIVMDYCKKVSKLATIYAFLTKKPLNLF